MRLLELFAGSCAVSKAFSRHGWSGTCVDIKRDIVPPPGFEVWICNVLDIRAADISCFDFIWASSPCEEFAVHGMKHYHPNPPYPHLGIKLFNETREICELSKRPYVMENVRAAQKFVGNAVHHCGPFYLWGNAVPPLMPCGITKGFDHAHRLGSTERKRRLHPEIIPIELASCVAEYAERLLEEKHGPIPNS